jgi:CBS domain-containing protein
VVICCVKERANAALYMMKKKGIRHLLVTDDNKARGIVTDRDFRLMRPSPATSLSIYEVHYLLDKVKVKEIMTKKGHYRRTGDAYRRGGAAAPQSTDRSIAGAEG